MSVRSRIHSIELKENRHHHIIIVTIKAYVTSHFLVKVIPNSKIALNLLLIYNARCLKFNNTVSPSVLYTVCNLTLTKWSTMSKSLGQSPLHEIDDGFYLLAINLKRVLLMSFYGRWCENTCSTTFKDLTII